ncbi:polyprenyl synthetase family protein [candidate division KSB1 bacterium]|nr:polyprenyl synthetase family protein [candidate division KSB1 bacterium]
MNSYDYFREMREVADIIKPEIKNIIVYIDKKYPLINNDFYYYYNKRILSNKLLLRPYLFKEILSILEIDWKSHKKIIALMEIINISTYQSNIAFDNKDEINKPINKSNQFIASIFSKLRVIDEILESQSYSPKQKYLISKEIVNAFEALYYGQYLDINILNFLNLDLITNDEKFNSLYQIRCKYLGGSLIKLITSISLIIAKKNPQEQKYNGINDFALNFGLAGQIVNDIGDLTSDGKSYTINKYSDLYNERLTLPLRYVVKKLNNTSKIKIIQYLNDPKNINAIKVVTKLYIEPFKKEIIKSLEMLNRIDIKTDKLLIIANLLNKSRFIKL